MIKKIKLIFFYDGKKIPFKSNTFDSVISTQVLEHVENSDYFIREINRVLKKNGLLLLSVPLVWEEHEIPYDFRRFTSFGLRNFLENNGFKILIHKKSCNGILCALQMTNLAFANYFFNKNFLFTLIGRVFVFLINLVAFLFWNIPSEDNLFLNNIVLAKKVR